MRRERRFGFIVGEDFDGGFVMDTTLGLFMIWATVIVASLLFPRVRRGLKRGLKAGFYLSALGAILVWTLTKGLLLVGYQRIFRGK